MEIHDHLPIIMMDDRVQAARDASYYQSGCTDEKGKGRALIQGAIN